MPITYYIVRPGDPVVIFLMAKSILFIEDDDRGLYVELYPRSALWPIYGFDFQICALGIGLGWRENEKCHSAQGKESFGHISKDSIVKAFPDAIASEGHSGQYIYPGTVHMGVKEAY